MLDEIVNRYEHFSDALISNILYQVYENKKIVSVTVNCMNKCKDYEFEVIRLVFEDVISIRFVEEENVSSLLVNAALIKKVNGVIIVDFFPLFYGENDLRENVESDFMIKCRGIHYDEVNKEV